jgi:hypothetical protein
MPGYVPLVPCAGPRGPRQVVPPAGSWSSYSTGAQGACRDGTAGTGRRAGSSTCTRSTMRINAPNINTLVTGALDQGAPVARFGTIEHQRYREVPHATSIAHRSLDLARQGQCNRIYGSTGVYRWRQTCLLP